MGWIGRLLLYVAAETMIREMMIFACRTLIMGADLNMAYGRRFGLIGRNGIGKTTLLRTLARSVLFYALSCFTFLGFDIITFTYCSDDHSSLFPISLLVFSYISH